MLKKFVLIPALLIGLNAIAQIGELDSFKNMRKIEVTGMAEKSVIPDEIYYSISLQEYKVDNKKVSIETLERQLVNGVAEAGLAKESLQIEDMQGFRQSLDKKKKNDDFLSSKQYVLKLNNLYKINGIMASVDSKGIAYTDIKQFSHTKIEEYRKEVKIAALKAAREKASYLLSGIDQQIGEVLQIQETGDYYPGPMQDMRMMKSEDKESSPQIDFKEIKLRYEVRAIFKIK